MLIYVIFLLQEAYLTYFSKLERKFNFEIQMTKSCFYSSLHISQNVSSCFYFGYTTNRSIHSRSSVRKSVLRNFANFTGKHQCQSLLLNKVVVLMCFPVNFAKFFKNTFFTEHLRTTSGLKKLKTSHQLLRSTFLLRTFFLWGSYRKTWSCYMNFISLQGQFSGLHFLFLERS